MSDQEWLKKSLTQVEAKVDKLDSKLDNIEVTMARNTESLIHHEKRTTLNEQHLELLRSEITPIKNHVQAVNTLILLITGIGGILLFLNELGLLKSLF